jgi:hypothetical protein
MDATPIHVDITSNYKRRLNISKRIWPKGNPTFHFESLLEQCPIGQGALDATNWRYYTILSTFVKNPTFWLSHWFNVMRFLHWCYVINHHMMNIK